MAPFGGPIWGPLGARDGGPVRPKLVYFCSRQRLSDFLLSGGLWDSFWVVFRCLFWYPLQILCTFVEFPHSTVSAVFDTNQRVCALTLSLPSSPRSPCSPLKNAYLVPRYLAYHLLFSTVLSCSQVSCLRTLILSPGILLIMFISDIYAWSMQVQLVASLVLVLRNFYGSITNVLISGGCVASPLQTTVTMQGPLYQTVPWISDFRLRDSSRYIFRDSVEPWECSP